MCGDVKEGVGLVNGRGRFRSTTLIPGRCAQQPEVCAEDPSEACCGGPGSLARSLPLHSLASVALEMQRHPSRDDAWKRQLDEHALM